MVAPKVVHVYNQQMGEVDLSDQLRHEYCVGMKSVKLWKKILFDILLRITRYLSVD